MVVQQKAPSGPKWLQNIDLKISGFCIEVRVLYRKLRVLYRISGFAQNSGFSIELRFFFDRTPGISQNSVFFIELRVLYRTPDFFIELRVLYRTPGFLQKKMCCKNNQIDYEYIKSFVQIEVTYLYTSDKIACTIIRLIKTKMISYKPFQPMSYFVVPSTTLEKTSCYRGTKSVRKMTYQLFLWDRYSVYIV